uniref:Kazal-type serine peptidase inhibitor domain 3 n=1 Tax=Pygocentrus nattereri TaxID=42514 RepID=A0AAR2LDA3_PYGNA
TRAFLDALNLCLPFTISLREFLTICQRRLDATAPFLNDVGSLSFFGCPRLLGDHVCEECMPELCHETRGCRAGLVRDSCGCCFECGNLEGQSCDLGDKNVHYGICGEGMECKLDPINGAYEDEGVHDAQCVCVTQEPMCGSDGRTYMNLCKYKEAAFESPGLNVSDGPCKTVPIIKVPPRDLVNVSGSSVVFLCEVFAFPMALVEWRKDGKDVILPGDDPHISVQSRGGPQKYELSSWLQIEETTRADSGTYRCTGRNEVGDVSAAAVLGILPPGNKLCNSNQRKHNINDKYTIKKGLNVSI